MRPIFQKIALLSLIMLIASCDSGVGGGITQVTSNEPAPENGIDGTAIKGAIEGATVSVKDANGNDVAIAEGGTTSGDGSYTLVFTEAAIDALKGGSLEFPLLVTVDASGATAVCDRDKADTDDDCGAGVAFGDTYTLPDPFELRAVVSEEIDLNNPNDIINVHVNPATDLAAHLALAAQGNNGTLTSNGVNTGNNQVLGLLSNLVGAHLSDLTLNRIRPVNLNNVDAATAKAGGAIVAAFASAMHDLVEDQGFANVGEAIQFVRDNIIAAADGKNLRGSGNALAAIARSLASSSARVATLLAAAGVDIPEVNDAATNASNNANLFAGFGTNPVLIAPPPVGDDTNPVNLTRAFVATMTEVIQGAVEATGASGFGPEDGGATELLADELRQVELLSSAEATQAFQQLEAAVIAAEAELAPGESDTDETDEDGDGVTGTISKSEDGNTVTVTGASTYTNESTGVTVTIEITEGQRTDIGAAGSFSATGVTMTTSQTVEGETTVMQTFMGDLEATFVDEGEGLGLGLDSLTFEGDIWAGEAGSGDSFGAAIALSNIEGTAEGSTLEFPTGQYDATLTFASDTESDLAIRMAGTIRAATQNFWIVVDDNVIAGTVTREGDVDTDTLSDGTVTLTFELDLAGTAEEPSGTLIGPAMVDGEARGEFTVIVEGEAVTTATVDSNGTIFYSDGTIQSLPARIF